MGIKLTKKKTLKQQFADVKLGVEAFGRKIKEEKADARKDLRIIQGSNRKPIKNRIRFMLSGKRN